MGRVGVHRPQRGVETRIGRGSIPAGALRVIPIGRAHRLDEADVEESIQKRLLAGCRRLEFPREQADDIVQRILVGGGQRQYWRQRVEQLATDVTRKLVSAAKENSRIQGLARRARARVKYSWRRSTT